MITIYLHSCNCGLTGHLVKNVKRWAKENNESTEVRQTRYSEDDRIDHAMYLTLAGIDLDFYDNIVVEDTGRITKLKEWQPSK